LSKYFVPRSAFGAQRSAFEGSTEHPRSSNQLLMGAVSASGCASPLGFRVLGSGSGCQGRGSGRARLRPSRGFPGCPAQAFRPFGFDFVKRKSLSNMVKASPQYIALARRRPKETIVRAGQRPTVSQDWECKRDGHPLTWRNGRARAQLVGATWRTRVTGKPRFGRSLAPNVEL
jgi:hypothetical protein